jgi:citrate synthase
MPGMFEKTLANLQLEVIPVAHQEGVRLMGFGHRVYKNYAT